MEEHLAAGEIEHPEARLGGWQGVIDDREQVALPRNAAVAGAGNGVERHGEDFGRQALSPLRKDRRYRLAGRACEGHGGSGETQQES